MRVPDGRQGPGVVPAARVNALDLRLRRRTGAPLAGEQLAVGAGSGVELAQLRPYVAGDDPRAIDAAATARTGQPHVRLMVPERALTTWLLLDRSPSMAFGTADRLKSDVAEGVATVMGRLGTRRGGRLGVLTCGDEAERVLPPRSGRGASAQLQRLLEEGVAVDGAPGRGLAGGLVRLGRLARGPGVVVVVSDFLDAPDTWARPLGTLRARHDVVCVEVRDRRDEELPDVGDLWLVDPKTGDRLRVDTSRRRLRERFAAASAERQAAVGKAIRRAGAQHAVLRTEGDWLTPLGRVLR